MKTRISILCILLSARASAQYGLHGTLADTTAAPVTNAAVSLLDPSDSTLAYYGVSDSRGQFEIKSVKPGAYLLQAASLGYRVYYKPLQVDKDIDLGYIILHSRSQELRDIVVRAEKIPMILKGDTVEYNAGAFRVKQDAVTEDLLRKLPGIQVDKSGNIKAQGKDVKKVLVDGKEFFGDDPKMATKNLPADAIDKVQVFGNRSDAAQFTGIDDGERDQTINLQLKDSKRKGYFGDEEAGGGSGDHYKLSGKLYRFQPGTQLSVLGMLNNINQFGFTFQDYLSFQGGLRGLMDGSGLSGTQMRNAPVNFGQPVSGLITSGGAGINYSAASGKADRFSISYLGNGAAKDLSEQDLSKNFLANGIYSTNEDLEQQSGDYAHRFRFSWRHDQDSARQIVIRGGATYTTNSTTKNLSSSSMMNDTVRNVLNSMVQDDGHGLDANLNASYIQSLRSRAWPLWKLNAAFTMESSSTATEWNNVSGYFPDTGHITDHQYQDNDGRHLSFEGGSSLVRRLGPGYYLEPALNAGSDIDGILRRQGALPAGTETDSLSPDFRRSWNWIRPGLSFRHNTRKTQLSATLEYESGQLGSQLRGAQVSGETFQYLKPSVFYQDSYAPGRQLNITYTTTVTAPGSLQMLPVTNYLQPLERITGNPLLSPEYRHIVQARWLRFDQFSGTSLTVHARGVYTRDRVSLSRSIAPDLSEDDRYINVPDDYTLAAGGEFSLPLRPLGLTLTVSLDENYRKGLSLVNDLSNTNTSLDHDLRLRVANRARKRWDIECGLEADLTSTSSSLESAGSNDFYHYNGYAQLSYRPDERLNFSASATVDRYEAASFPNSVTVPLVNAAASWYFLPARRGVLTVEAFDLFNQNTSVQRLSQLNYLLERRTNIIRQYFLLSFKYRLSKTGGKSPVTVDIRR